MQNKRYLFPIFVSLLMALLANCGSSGQADLPGANPEDAAVGFYHWYLGERSGPPKDARESAYLHPELVQRIDEMMESPVPMDQISFVCAQDFPDSVEVVSSNVRDETATVQVRTSFGSNVRLGLQAYEGEWRIIDVKCE